MIGWRFVREDRPDYQQMMREALDRAATAERMIQEADCIEQLDIARSALLQAQAEIQQVIRLAKREHGVALRPIAETEEMHRRLRNHMQREKAERLCRPNAAPSAERLTSPAEPPQPLPPGDPDALA